MIAKFISQLKEEAQKHFDALSKLHARGVEFLPIIEQEKSEGGMNTKDDIESFTKHLKEITIDLEPIQMSF